MRSSYPAILTRGPLATCERSPAGLRVSVGFATFVGPAQGPALAAWVQQERDARRRVREDLRLWLGLTDGAPKP